MLGKLLQLRQARRGAAQFAGNVEQVARPSAGAEQGMAAPNRAGKHDVGDGDGRLGQVAAGQKGFIGLGEREKSVEEAFNPSSA